MKPTPVSRSELAARLGAATHRPTFAAAVGLLPAIVGGGGVLAFQGQHADAAVPIFAAIALAGGVIGLAASIAVGVLVRRELDADVAAPVAGLLAVVTRAELEDFRGEAPQAGVRELREIAGGFNHLLRLQRRQQQLNQTALDAVTSRQQAAAESAKLHKQAEAASYRDALTGLYNRRKLDIDLAAECERAIASGAVLSFVMVDIDHFKIFNDTHGHQGGDELLREMGKVLGNIARAVDTCYRYGGEEFALILRHTTVDGAYVVIDRLRERAAARFLELGTPATASFGVAALPDHGMNPEQLIASADGALYVAKAQGRNRVIKGVPQSTTVGSSTP